jgi:hypothetical protein
LSEINFTSLSVDLSDRRRRKKGRTRGEATKPGGKRGEGYIQP